MDDLAKHDKNRITLDSLNCIRFKDAIIPDSEVEKYFESILNAEADTLILQISYSPNTSYQRYINLVNFLQQYRQRRQIINPYYILSTADYGIN